MRKLGPQFHLEKKRCIFFSGMVDKTIRIGSLQVGSEVEDIPRMDFILIQEIKVLCKEPEEWGWSLKLEDMRRQSERLLNKDRKCMSRQLQMLYWVWKPYIDSRVILPAYLICFGYCSLGSFRKELKACAWPTNPKQQGLLEFIVSKGMWSFSPPQWVFMKNTVKQSHSEWFRRPQVSNNVFPPPRIEPHPWHPSLLLCFFFSQLQTQANEKASVLT